MSRNLLWRHLVQLRGAPLTAISLAAAGSFIGQIAALVRGAPLWVFVLVAVAPWVPIVILELVWAYRHYRWVAVFCMLIVSQAVYVFENTAQVIQVNVLGGSVAASSIFGAFDRTRVQFLWATWAVLAVLLLINRFPRNPWLWLVLAVATLDAIEHTLTFLSASGVFSEPAQLVLSAAEFVMLYLALAWQLERTYNAWLARAFPSLPENKLIETSARLEELRLRPGERVALDPERCHVVTSGRGSVLRAGPGGHDILVRVLSPGDVVAAESIVLAESALELLAVPASAVA